MSQAYQPLHHKYRPGCFDDLVGQEAIAATLKQALLSNRIAPAYLFSGPRGTGKTSSARILARSLNCLKNEKPSTKPCGECDVCKTIASSSSLDVIEIDAASNTGVDNIRELIERSRFAPVQARWKVYVIDECHMLSTAAFNALLKTLEEPPPKVVFILATTDPQRVLPTILSRCQCFEFKRIPLQVLCKHLEMIASKESISIEPKALELIAQRAQGGLRDAESMLDQLSLLPQPIRINIVWDLVGAVPEKELLSLAHALSKKDPIKLLENCRQILDQGKDPLPLLQGLASLLRDLVLLNAAPDRPELTSISSEFHQELGKIACDLDLQKLLEWQAKLKGTEIQLRHSFQPRLWLEVLLLSLLAESNTNQNKVQPEFKNNSIKARLISKPKAEVTNEDKRIVIGEQSEKREANQEDSVIAQLKPQDEANQNFVELWNQILGNLELPSTRMLLSQQAQLIRLTQEKAFVQVSANWMGMVQSRKTLLEEAISQTLGSNRQLILESNIEAPAMQSPQEKIKKQNPTIILNNESGSNQVIDNPSIQKKANITKGKSESKESEPKNDEIDNQAKSLADFFNGKVLDVEI